MDWFVSDTHFNHANIIKHCKRPFSSVEEMNETLLKNINDRVKPGDRLFHLGDFAYKNSRGVQYYLDRINCKNIYLVRGNHDKMKQWEEDLFCGVENLTSINTEVNGENKTIVLCHYAMRVWNKSHHGVAHAWGHSHSSLPDDPNSLSMDVGVDNIAKLLSPDGIRRPEDYRPISVVEFFDYMKLKTWKPIDHHGRD
jgi:calcineurin-like phosphoesterase family protein